MFHIQLPIDPQKPWNFSTSNDLQYTVFQTVLLEGSDAPIPILVAIGIGAIFGSIGLYR